MALDVRSESAFLKTVTTGSAGDFLYVSTIAAAELDSVAALGNSRVKPLTIDTGAVGTISRPTSSRPIWSSTPVRVETPSTCPSKRRRGAQCHRKGNYGHGATITLGEGRDYLIVDTWATARWPTSMAAAAPPQIALWRPTTSRLPTTRPVKTSSSSVFRSRNRGGHHGGGCGPEGRHQPVRRTATGGAIHGLQRACRGLSLWLGHLRSA